MRRLISPVVAAGALFSASVLLACSVPVFRYALEQWRPDSFRVVVFHRGELSADQRLLVEKIEPTDLDAAYVGNVWIKTVDLDHEPAAEFVELWQQQQTETLPWMLAQSPKKFGRTATTVASEFTADNVSRLLDSPLRKTIGQRLLKGESVVWVLLESGDKDADTAAAETLSGELKRLQGDIKLPPIDQKDIDDGFLTVNPDELQIRFSMLRVARDDPEEAAFVSMLLNTEPDLRDAEFNGQPMALPVFGRGRVLYALIGKGINAETIEDACRFLTGACQCTVKAQNPGVDLLTTIDWDSVIVPQSDHSAVAPTLTGLGGFVNERSVSNDKPLDGSANSAISVAMHERAIDGAASSSTETVRVAAQAAGSVPSAGTLGASPGGRSVNVATLTFVVFGSLAGAVALLSLLMGRRTV